MPCNVVILHGFRKYLRKIILIKCKVTSSECGIVHCKRIAKYISSVLLWWLSKTGLWDMWIFIQNENTHVFTIIAALSCTLSELNLFHVSQIFFFLRENRLFLKQVWFFFFLPTLGIFHSGFPSILIHIQSSKYIYACAYVYTYSVYLSKPRKYSSSPCH